MSLNIVRCKTYSCSSVLHWLHSLIHSGLSEKMVFQKKVPFLNLNPIVTESTQSVGITFRFHDNLSVT